MIPYIDMHCDTLMGSAVPGFSLIRNDRQVDFERLSRAGAMAQCFAVFLPQRGWFSAVGLADVTDWEYIRRASGLLAGELEKAPELAAPARTAAGIGKNHRAGRVSALLTMEDGRALEGRIENLDLLYGMGFCMIALLWNHENCLGFPNSEDPAVMARGLKPFGKEAVQRMAELGMLVDVSHLSEGGFRDVAELVKGPFVASHSNARALAPHRRNLTDGQLRVLGEHGGAAGLNFYAPFLQPDCSPQGSTAALIAKHARHMANVGGVECVALGSDFDGIDGQLEIDSAERVPLLWDALRKEGFSEADVERIAWRNVLRVWKEVVG